MNHQELLDRLNSTGKISTKELPKLLETLPLALADLIKADESMAIPNFGTFEVHKRLERVVENAATGRRTLTPPHLVLRFRNTIASRPDYTLHNLAAQLARRNKIELEKALQVVSLCFSVLREGLQADGFASLLGFGTFHAECQTDTMQTQLAFVPDENLAALINRPFAELPEAELNPDVDLRELDAVNAEFEKPAKIVEPESEKKSLDTLNSSAPIVTAEPENAISETENAAAEAATDIVEVEKTSLETDDILPTENSVNSEIENTVSEQHDESNTLTNNLQIAENKANNSYDLHWRRAAIVFAVVALGLSIFILLRWGRPEIQSIEKTSIVVNTDTTTIDSMQTEVLPDSTSRTQRFTLGKPSEVFTHFEIDGVLDEHTVEFGDILIRLAEHYYGNPYFVKYIIDYNGLPASGEAAPGTVLRIPRLRQKQSL